MRRDPSGRGGSCEHGLFLGPDSGTSFASPESRTGRKEKAWDKSDRRQRLYHGIVRSSQSTDGSVILGLHGPCWSCGDGHPLSLVQTRLRPACQRPGISEGQVPRRVTPRRGAPRAVPGLHQTCSLSCAPVSRGIVAVARHHNEPSDPGPLG